MTTTDEQYPEHVKLQAVSKETQAVGDFLEWAVAHGYIDVYGVTESLIAEHFGIDLKELDREKKAILDAIRNAAEADVSIHMTETSMDPDGWWAVKCRCGWHKNGRASRQSARMDGDRHLQEANGGTDEQTEE